MAQVQRPRPFIGGLQTSGKSESPLQSRANCDSIAGRPSTVLGVSRSPPFLANVWRKGAHVFGIAEDSTSHIFSFSLEWIGRGLRTVSGSLKGSKASHGHS